MIFKNISFFNFFQENVEYVRRPLVWKAAQPLVKCTIKNALSVAFVKNELTANSLKKMENLIVKRIGQ